MRSEIKGSWLVTVHRLLEREPPEVRAAVVAHLPEEHATVLDGVLPGQWYPEELLQALLGGLRQELAGGDAARFEALLERGVELAIHRFFSAMLRLTTPSFVLGRVPTLWNLTRRGMGRVSVERVPEGSLLRYRSFPFFGDESYLLLTRASIRLLLRQCGMSQPRVELLRWTDDSCDVLARHDH